MKFKVHTEAKELVRLVTLQETWARVELYVDGNLVGWFDDCDDSFNMKPSVAFSRHTDCLQIQVKDLLEA